MKKIEGLIAAPFTPMNTHGKVNLDIIPEYYEFLKDNNIKGAFINGSTGEGVSLTLNEKMHITKTWAKCYQNDKGVPIINLVGGTSYQECIDISQYSEEAGVYAIAIISPYYFKPPSTQQLVEFIALIAQSVPKLPVYFYHIPVLSGYHLPMIDLLKAISPIVPNFAGIKYTHEDFMDFLSCLNYQDKRFDLLWGRDECLLSALVLGAKGTVGSTYNYAAPLYYQLIEAFNNNNLGYARSLQQKSIDMISLLNKYGGLAVGKAYMRYIGLDLGNFRLPFKNLNDSSFAQFKCDVDSLKINSMFSQK